RSLDTEHQSVVLKVIAELSAADHSASSVARQRIRRRKKRRRTQIPPPDAVRAIADLATQIESGPARRHVAANSIATTLTQETTANARPTRKSIWPRPGRPQHEIFRKLAGNVGESAASMRLLLDKVNKVCGSSLGQRAYPEQRRRFVGQDGQIGRCRRSTLSAPRP